LIQRTAGTGATLGPLRREVANGGAGVRGGRAGAALNRTAGVARLRMSELYPEHSVVTVDVRDFRVYRRNKREAISLICPP